MATQVQVAIDAADPHELAAFWAAALHYAVEDHSAVVAQLLAAGRLPEDEVVTIDGKPAFRDVATARDPDGVGPRLFIARVPEAKTVKNRVHLDLHIGPEGAAAEVERLVALGATVAWTSTDRGPLNTTMRDPQGNEFCVS